MIEHTQSAAENPSEPESAENEEALQLTAAVGQEVIPGRIRNDGIRVQARYMEIPGAVDFNARVRALLDDVIVSSNATYIPEVFAVSAGLSDRGCIAGVLNWPAARVLSDARTGPVDGAGTSIVCEIESAFDSVIGVSFRTVSGAPGAVDRDLILALFVDVRSGEVIAGDDLWAADGAESFWTRVAEVARREAHSLSAAPLAPPNAEQLELAQRALASVTYSEGDGATFIIPPGFSAPELETLGVEPTADPIAVTIDAATLADWESDAARSLFARRHEPFSGLPAWRADTPVDCSFVACVAVTYDDGPSSYTQQLLDTLRADRAPASFYMLGSAANQQPDLVREVAASGFEIGSHTMTHPDLTSLKPQAARAEVLDAAHVLGDITGSPVTTYRPPYGAVNNAVIAAVNQPAILWTIDTLDWKDPGVDELVRRAADTAEAGDIILFHDTHADSVDSARAVMRRLRDRGLTPVTVSTMFGGAAPVGRVLGR